MRVLIAGPHGGYNLGDELIFGVVARQIQETGCEVMALSGNPSYTRANHRIESVAAPDLKHLRIGPLKSLESVDALVLAGGEQLQESRWGNPLWGLLPTTALLVKQAARLGLPCMLWGVGASRIRNIFGRWLIRHWVSLAAAITVRDADSERRLLKLGVPSEKISLAADPVFALNRVPSDAAQMVIERLLGRDESPIILVSPARDRLIREDYLAPLVEGCSKAARRSDAKLVIQVMDTRSQYDAGLLNRPEFRGTGFVSLPECSLAPEILPYVQAGVHIVVSARMHPLILAATQGTPWVNIARAEKMSSFGREVGGPSLDIRRLTAEDVDSLITATLDASRCAWDENIRCNVERMRTRSFVSLRVFKQGILGQ